MGLLSRRALALLALAAACGAARADAPSEGVVKAAFVYNFAKFTEWPADALPPRAPIVLCLPRHRESYGGAFAAVDGKPAQGRALQLRYAVPAEELKSCQIVWLDDRDARQSAELLRAVRGAPVLTVGDLDGFAAAGGVLGLVAEDERIRFEVNAEAAQQAGLKLASQLMGLARVVRPRRKD